VDFIHTGVGRIRCQDWTWGEKGVVLPLPGQKNDSQESPGSGIQGEVQKETKKVKQRPKGVQGRRGSQDCRKGDCLGGDTERKVLCNKKYESGGSLEGHWALVYEEVEKSRNTWEYLLMFL